MQVVSEGQLAVLEWLLDNNYCDMECVAFLAIRFVAIEVVHFLQHRHSPAHMDPRLIDFVAMVGDLCMLQQLEPMIQAHDYAFRLLKLAVLNSSPVGRHHSNWAFDFSCYWRRRQASAPGGDPMARRAF